MATYIYLERESILFGAQNPAQDWHYKQHTKAQFGVAAVIAKGNVIEGIEAKW